LRIEFFFRFLRYLSDPLDKHGWFVIVPGWWMEEGVRLLCSASNMSGKIYTEGMLSAIFHFVVFETTSSRLGERWRGSQ
jgi:hypothetical protein